MAAASFSGMVRWWEEWQLRVLALSSLFLQLFLFVSSTFRKYRVPPLLRSCIWLAYLGGDALAIYALATVFNRHRQPSPAADGHGPGPSSSMLEVMWVPVFLVHLGGQDSITAYNIEDNELWARHAVAMSSQAAVAVYVFWRSWSGGQVPESSPALLLFAAGFLKLGERLWALRRASITRLAAVRSSTPATARTVVPLDSYVREARRIAKEAKGQARDHYAGLCRPMLEQEAQNELMELFIDFPAPYPRRLANLRSFLALGDDDAYQELCILLDQAFQFFYTKKEAAYTIIGIYLRTFSMLLGIAAIASFNDSHKDGFDTSDVMVSYILLWSTLVLEICALVWLADWRLVPSGTFVPEMQRTVAQFNLIGFVGFVARSRWLTVVRCIGMLFRCNELDYVVGQQYYPHHCWSTPVITKFIRKQLKDGWVGLSSAAEYRRFNDRRGQWNLPRDEDSDEQLVQSVTKLPFDESVLIWHIATDICLDHYREHIVAADERASAAREISDYMMYLLVLQADMLMPGTQQSLFATASRETRHVLRRQERTYLLSIFLYILVQVQASSSPPAIHALVAPIIKDSKTSLYTLSISNKNYLLDLSGQLLWSPCSATHPTVPCSSNNGGRTCTVRPTNPVTGERAAGDLTLTDIVINATDGRTPTSEVTVRGVVSSCAPGSLLRSSFPTMAAGDAGLGRGGLSLPTQLYSKLSLKRQFAVCLPSTASAAAPGVAFFGSGPYNLMPPTLFDASTVLSYTDLVRSPSASASYSIRLRGIAVNQEAVVVRLPPGGGAGVTKLDTAAPYTVLRRDVYRAFVSAFAKATARMPRMPSVAPFELCFNSSALGFTRVGYAVAPIDLMTHGGGNWTVFGSNSLAQVASDTACLAFVDGGRAARSAVTVGAFQMENNFLLFDEAKSRLGFSGTLLFIRTTCANFKFATVVYSWPGMVQWWEEWQLRVLALSSLFVQLFLFLSSPFRRYRIPALFRTCIWLAYLGSDALAVYGLATLFNRHGRKTTPAAAAAADGRSSSILEVLWAPVFLIHLRGQETITAYNVEDNELWARHAVAMSSQAAVAVYVFCRSWRGGDKVPVRCPVSLFVAGFLKMGNRLWALRRASITRLATVTRKVTTSTSTGDEGDPESTTTANSLRDYVNKASELATRSNIADDNGGNNRQAARRRSRERRDQLLAPDSLLDELLELFIDLPAPYARWLGYLRSFLQLQNYDAYYDLCNLLDFAFQFIYTMKSAAYTIAGMCVRVTILFLGIMAAAGFDGIDSNKDGLDRDDVKVTHILLIFSIVMEFGTLVWLGDWKWVPLWMLAPEMQHTIAQFNLIGFASRSRWPTMPMWMATLFGCKNYHWYLEYRPSTATIVEFIRRDLKSAWVDVDHSSVTAYRRFNDRRGEWTLQCEQCYRELGWSVTSLPFDESILVWHIATFVCLHRMDDISPAAGHADDERITVATTCSMEISNYLMYLLSFKPDMLMPGTRQSLLDVASREIRHALKHQRQWLGDRDLVRWIVTSTELQEGGAS
uniref:Peptidase A1 domain-containing protein n=1 Tax=Leersia perrieri TaxID=77586 RepID=A0A0D9VE82_9ORYZ